METYKIKNIYKGQKLKKPKYWKTWKVFEKIFEKIFEKYSFSPNTNYKLQNMCGLVSALRPLQHTIYKLTKTYITSYNLIKIIL